MKHATDAIRAAREAAPARPADDPLRNFLSEVVLRDHARLMKLTLRKLHEGERMRSGDFIHFNHDELKLLRLPWWRARRYVTHELVYRYIE